MDVAVNGKRAAPNCATLGNITAKWELVTAETAAEYLLVNVRNRNLMSSLSERYSRDQREGYWQTTHEALAFAQNGTLIDGQHRLTAIVQSGLAVWMLVVRGLPDSVIEVINRGRTRTLAHTLQIMGYAHSDSRTVAAAKVMWYGPVMHRGGMFPTDSAVRRFMDSHLEALTFGVQVVPKSLGPALLAGVLARAYYHANPDDLRRFVAAMRDLVPIEEQRPGDRTARTFGAWTRATSKHGGGMPFRIGYYRKAQRAVRGYLDGEELTKLYETADDLFPLREPAAENHDSQQEA